jgi:hypothetical protein
MTEQNSPQARKDIEAYIIAQAWKDENYKQELLNNPRSIFEKEFGLKFPCQKRIEVLEENPNTLYFVLPISPDLSKTELSDEELEVIAGGGFFDGLGEAFSTVYNTGKDFGDTIYDSTH